MHIGEISFCDKICYNIKSDEYKKQILQELENKIGFRVIQKHYQIYNTSLDNVLCNNPHYVCVRTNGNPYLLYLTKYNNANQCIFIDKKIQQGYFYPRMIISKMWFDDDLFNGTLIDGEMINGQVWTFLIHDILYYTGQQLSNINLIHRINMIYNLLSTKYVEDDVCCCVLKVKKYFPCYQSEQIQQFIESLPYTCRGLYFKPMFHRYKDILLNFDDSLIKKVVRVKLCDGTFQENIQDTSGTKTNIQAKPIEKHEQNQIIYNTNNIRLMYGKKTSQPDIYELYVSMDSNDFEIACVQKISTSKLLKSIFSNANINEKKALLCEFNATFHKWTPLKEA